MGAHPLDPLTADEATVATRVLRESGALPDGTLFPLVTLAEPPKAELLKWTDGAPIDRQVRYLCWHRDTKAAYEALVSATNEAVVEVKQVPGVQPLYLLFAELYMGIELIKADARFLAALKRRGIDNADLIQIDPWPAGSHGLDIDPQCLVAAARGVKKRRTIVPAAFKGGRADPLNLETIRHDAAARRRV